MCGDINYSACPSVVRILEPVLTFSVPNGILNRLCYGLLAHLTDLKNVAANFEHERVNINPISNSFYWF